MTARQNYRLTNGEKVALVQLRRCDWSQAILDGLLAVAKFHVTARDHRSIIERGLAHEDGRLTVAGRTLADRVLIELSRDAGLTVRTRIIGEMA